MDELIEELLKFPVSISSLLINLGASLVWWLAIIGLGYLWYSIYLKGVEREWIKKHSLMLLVYFRNVDWRCNRLRTNLQKDQKYTIKTASSLRLELVKMQSDLAALERLVGMWARRVESFPSWYPYAQNYRNMLDAHDELQAAILRHLTPLLELLHGIISQEISFAEAEDPLKKYFLYFLGESDRLWNGGLRIRQNGTRQNGPIVEDVTDLKEQRPKMLSRRLSDMFESLIDLLKKSGGTDTQEIKIWFTDENSKDLWFADH